MKYCNHCILPDTRPGLVIGDDGICNACKNSFEKKNNIDWKVREAQFSEVVTNAKQRSRGYDCIIPVSGGKDSHWQVVKCLEYGLNPLAITWKTPARTAVGVRNLENLVGLGVDHIDYRINPAVERKFMIKSLERFGTTAIPMHMAIFSIPSRVAVKFNIPLVVWGENSAFEYGHSGEAHKGFQLDSEWLRTYGVMHGTTAYDWIDEELTEKDLTPYFFPTDQELGEKGILAIFMGYYFPWDPTETHRIAMEHGFRGRSEGPRTGYYDFADVDDDFISIHHWMKWYKFGFTRLFDNLSLEIRNKRMTRKQALEIIRQKGDQTPYADIDKFCAFAGLSQKRFFKITERFRNPGVWQRRMDGVWAIPGFLIKDWKWA
jgi:N-acetyl sugar amidotransferase